jgi:hypothetical protein
MIDRDAKSFPVASEILSGAASPFRFEVTWRSLTPLRHFDSISTGGASRFSPSTPAVFPPPSAPEAGPRFVREAEVPVHAVSGLGSREISEGAESRAWEMIRHWKTRLAMLAPAPPRPETPPVAVPFTAPAELTRPRSLIVAVPLLALLLVVGYQWMRRNNSPSAERSAADAMEMGGSGWISEWASDAAGSARGRQLSLYRPSISMSDYHLSFLGRIERGSLGWVFRAADSSNYYAAKLDVAQRGSPLTLTHFAVIRGVEGPHNQRTLPLIAGEHGTLKVRLDATGPIFTVWVLDRVVDEWADDRLTRGGLGFFNERKERGEVWSIRISFLKVVPGNE